MARRKNSEVLISGDRVDPRTRVTPSSPLAGQDKVKPTAGAFAEDNLKRRPRTKPQVIDLVDGQAANPNAADALADLERELGMVPTAAPGEGLASGLSMPPPVTDERADWQEIKRARKAELDLPAQTEPPQKPVTSDSFDLSSPIVPKPQADLPVPVKKQLAALPDAKSDKSSGTAQNPVVKANSGADVSLKAQGNAIAQTVVRSILERFKAEAHKNGGQLSLANIDSLQAEFGAQTQALSLAFEQSFEAYVLARERAAWGSKRDFPFDRLIVKKFSHLFADKAAGFDRVSRRMLPGFFMAMGMMLGPDVVDEFQERCRGLVERIRSERQDAFDWSDVYAAEEGRTVLMDALVPIALHFGDYKKRRDWFIALINGHLSPARSSEKDDAGWEMTVPAFEVFLNALLSDLETILSDSGKKPRIVKRYGADVVDLAIGVLKRVNKA